MARTGVALIVFFAVCAAEGRTQAQTGKLVLAQASVYATQQSDLHRYAFPREWMWRELVFEANVVDGRIAQQIHYILADGPAGRFFLVNDYESTEPDPLKFMAVHSTPSSFSVGDSYTFQAYGSDDDPVGPGATAQLQRVLPLPVLLEPYQYEPRGAKENEIKLDPGRNSMRHPAEMTPENGTYLFRWRPVPGAHTYLLLAENNIDRQRAKVTNTECRLTLKSGTSYVVKLLATDRKVPPDDIWDSPMGSANTSSLSFLVLPR